MSRSTELGQLEGLVEGVEREVLFLQVSPVVTPNTERVLPPAATLLRPIRETVLRLVEELNHLPQPYVAQAEVVTGRITCAEDQPKGLIPHLRAFVSVRILTRQTRITKTVDQVQTRRRGTLARPAIIHPLLVLA